jgi:hypothetical protein
MCIEHGGPPLLSTIQRILTILRKLPAEASNYWYYFHPECVYNLKATKRMQELICQPNALCHRQPHTKRNTQILNSEAILNLEIWFKRLYIGTSTVFYLELSFYPDHQYQKGTRQKYITLYQPVCEDRLKQLLEI